MSSSTRFFALLIKEGLQSTFLSVYSILHGLPLYTSTFGGFLAFQNRLLWKGQVAPKLRSMQWIFTVGGRVTILPVPGGKINRPAGALTDIMVGMYQVFVDKEYERDARYLPRKGDVVVDVGAFAGLWTVRVASLVGLTGRVLAIEPNPQVFQELESNVRLNGLTNIDLVNLALGESIGQLELFTESTSLSASSVSMNHVMALSFQGNVVGLKVDSTSMDELIRGKMIQRVDLLKLDIEGSELSVLRGSVESLRKRMIKKIIVEIHEDVASEKEVIHLLKSNGFVIDYSERHPHPLCDRVLLYCRQLG